MMPIRFPTEAANDPDGKLDGLPESTGEDDIDALRGEASGKPERKERGATEPRQRRESSRDDKARDKDSDKP
jgi:hypothetical protein